MSNALQEELALNKLQDPCYVHFLPGLNSVLCVGSLKLVMVDSLYLEISKDYKSKVLSLIYQPTIEYICVDAGFRGTASLSGPLELSWCTAWDMEKTGV